MLDPEVQARLERLNRERLPEAAPGSSPVAPAGATSPAPAGRLFAEPEEVVRPPVMPGRRPRPEPGSLLHEQLAARLEQMKRKRARVEGESEEEAPTGTEAGGDRSLGALVPGEVVENTAGACYRVRRPLSEWLVAGVDPKRVVSAEELAAQPWQRGPAGRLDRDVGLLAEHFPHEALLLDLETCGLSGAPLFLAGIVVVEQGTAVLEQYLARDYREERAVLVELWRRTFGRPLLVTFNGKTFDWPLVHERSTVHKLGRRPATSSRSSAPVRAPLLADLPLGPRDARPEPEHCDLLQVARRRWRGRGSNCRLQTLERRLLGRRRPDDVPSHQVPVEYHAFVRSGDATMLRGVLAHNALDLATLYQLAARAVHEG
jgi:hypothetical protein